MQFFLPYVQNLSQQAQAHFSRKQAKKNEHHNMLTADTSLKKHAHSHYDKKRTNNNTPGEAVKSNVPLFIQGLKS